MSTLAENRVKKISEEFSQLEASEMKSRLSRLLVLDSIRTIEVYTGILAEPSDSIDPFVREAAEAYVHGLYRSCIFCCATAVNQILVEGLVQESNYDSQMIVDLRETTFGGVIGKAKRTQRLQVVVEDADWLNKVRNKVAAHSCYVTTGRARSEKQLQLEIETMVRDARTLIDLLNPEDRIIVESSTVTYKGKVITFGQALETKDHHGTEVVWHNVQFYLIPVLALEAYRRLYNLMKRLQIYVITRHHTRAPYDANQTV